MVGQGLNKWITPEKLALELRQAGVKFSRLNKIRTQPFAIIEFLVS